MCAGDDWRHSHNYEHHTFTNILGQRSRRRLRVPARQRRSSAWNVHAPRPADRRAVVLALFFQWGVGAARPAHRRDPRRRASRSRELARAHGPFVAQGRLAARARTTSLFPALALWNAPRVVRRQPARQRDAQRVDVRRHLLRPLPGGRARLHRGGDARTRAAATGTCASSTARRTSRAAARSTS